MDVLSVFAKPSDLLNGRTRLLLSPGFIRPSAAADKPEALIRRCNQRPRTDGMTDGGREGAEEVYCLPNAQVAAAAAKSRGKEGALASGEQQLLLRSTDDAPPQWFTELMPSRALMPFELEATAIVQCFAKGSVLCFPLLIPNPKWKSFVESKETFRRFPSPFRL